MSDSSEEEDLSRFQEAVDTSFTKLINESRGNPDKSLSYGEPKQKSERYLETASHYNDVKVPEQMQRRIGEKISAVIGRNIEFVDVQEDTVKKRKIKGGVKLFKDSKELLLCEEAPDLSTEVHNSEAKKAQLKKKHKVKEMEDLDESEKVSAVAVSGDYVLSKQEIKLWKSRRKEKLFRYKKKGKSKVLTAVE